MIRLLPVLLVACTWGASPSVAPQDAGPPSADGPAAHAVERLSAGGTMYVMDRDQLRAAMQQPSAVPRLYNVWATWCAPCIAELPTLEAFADAHPHKVELWYVNTDHPKVAVNQVPRFLAEHGLDDRRHIRQHADESDLTAGIPDFPQVLPVTLVVAPDGSTRHTWAGAIQASHLEQALGL